MTEHQKGWDGKIASAGSGHSQMVRSTQHTQELLSLCFKAFSPLVCLIFDLVARLGSDCIRKYIFVLQDTLRYHFGHHLAEPRNK